MTQNPIDEVFEELEFSQIEKTGFMKFLKYAKVCEETGNNNQLKSQLEEIVNDIVAKQN